MEKGLFKSICLIMLLLVTLFSFSIKSDAASFAYEDFNWDEFSKQNNTFWVSFCETDPDEECKDIFLDTKKEFYTRLYSLLAKMQRKGYVIDDSTIIATVFFGLDMESFRDPEGTHQPYKIDDNVNTKDLYLGEMKELSEELIRYFEEETDTLKTLINNFVGYKTTCYGTSNEVPTIVTDSQGNSTSTCIGSDYQIIEGKCVYEVDIYSGNFFDSIGLSFDGNKNLIDCQNKSKELGYTDTKLISSTTSECNEKFYWKFLETSEYLDNKDHLQDYYVSVLGKVKKEHMNELTKEEKEEYKDIIVDIRIRIITNIKEIIKNYKGMSQQFNSVAQYKYWWPIGSEEAVIVDGVEFASEAPSKTAISSNFGLRTDPLNGTPASNHNGIDIPGDLGITNVIASKDGIIAETSQDKGINCIDGGDTSCGGGYGNYVIIQHVDGNYTLYAHLAQGSITVKTGDSVDRGQVIGKVGNSGKSTGAHLHFEVRVGGNSNISTVDPLIFVSVDNPRASGMSSQALDWIGSMEGTGPMEGNNYKVYADSGGVLTVGHGITIENNKEAFKINGIDPNTLVLGSLVPKEVVDKIYENNLNTRIDNIKNIISANGLNFNENQILALASLQFNSGNINGFLENFKTYGSTDALCSNWWQEKALHDRAGNYLSGLKKRRIAECDLFVNGNLDMSVYD